ncbi:unnamed protein product [Gongylonema pulchrum]|uniref:Uncharacterized protein n=1 Tax=Gongylonema pulchrum TaxID=637853 RepID=A0A3P7MH56_9BILA|nr:unnamed protein product [Gongylonema pulchrum]
MGKALVFQLGYVLGSVAAASYFGSRIAQLLKSYRRNSSEGLSHYTFYIMIAGNLTYGISVLLESTGWHYVLHHMPWLVGSLGVCFADSAVAVQCFYYNRRKPSTTVKQPAPEKDRP